MAEVTPPFPVEVSNAYNAWDYGAPYKDLIAEGILGATDLAVTQRGAGANNSVDIAAGTCWVYGDDNPTQQPSYRCYNNAARNLVLTQDATNPRIALIVAHAYDAHFSGATYTWALEAILGTPAGAPVAPALPNNCMLLATVTVPAVGGNVTNAQITDNRVRISDARSVGATNGQVLAWNTSLGRWVPGSAGSYTLIDSYVVTGSSVASYDTNTRLGGNIPQTYKHLGLVASVRNDFAAANNSSYIRVNNDSGTNYSYQTMQIANSVVSGTQSPSVSQLYLGEGPGSTGLATYFGGIEVLILDYTSAIKRTMFSSHYNVADNAAANMRAINSWGTYLVAAAITRLTLFPAGAANWVVTSGFWLYGIN